MKKLEELGISPGPWKTLDTCIGDSKHITNGNKIIAMGVENEDARLIAAAPELYRCMRERVMHLCVFNCGECPIHCPKKPGECHVQKWRDALAKAAGESEVHHD